MLSKKLTDLIDRIDRTEPTLARRAALVGLRLRLEAEAPQSACTRCGEAGWAIGWEAEVEGGDKEWIPRLGKCGKNMVLAEGEDATVFCTESTETGDAA